MTQDIRQIDQVFRFSVESPCEQMSQVMGEYFFQADPGQLCYLFHFSSDVRSVLGLPGSGAKDDPCTDLILSYI